LTSRDERKGKRKRTREKEIKQKRGRSNQTGKEREGKRGKEQEHHRERDHMSDRYVLVKTLVKMHHTQRRTTHHQNLWAHSRAQRQKGKGSHMHITQKESLDTKTSIYQCTNTHRVTERKKRERNREKERKREQEKGRTKRRQRKRGASRQGESDR